MKPIELDGRTGEGGGQLVRVAVALAAVTSQAVKITNIRGNRPKGGGLKGQHLAAVKWLAEASEADVDGLQVGSKTLTFIPSRKPSELLNRNIRISADSSAASTLLILQAILPFLIYAADDSGTPIMLELSGGTNTSFSPSFEYLDQIVLPVLLERFNIKIERELKCRGWSLGHQSRGTIMLRIYPLPAGENLHCRAIERREPHQPRAVERIDVTIVVPMAWHDSLHAQLAADLTTLFPDAEIYFKPAEDSTTDARWYILAVAHSGSGVRWARDILSSSPRKTKGRVTFPAQLSSKLCRELYEEVSVGGSVDEHLQDQLICFQALSHGISSFPRGGDEEDDAALAEALRDLTIGGETPRVEKTHEPFGHGSLHARTVRWVVGEMLPQVQFYKKGDIVKGAGICFGESL